MKSDVNLQMCDGPYMKHSFPDIDYALLGYNILKGYPLAFGHDPGFTFPIFQADYSSQQQTADCRYSVPDGVVAIPDVSCVTSFSSKTIQTSYELSNALSVSANVHGGGFGVQFSASAGYKESSSVISSGSSIFIISTAQCRYYFVKLVEYKPPQFSPLFKQWIHKLDQTDNPDVYYEFIEYFGTHYPTEVTFGAKYTYEYKMSSSDYRTQTDKGVNVAVSASYSGMFSVGGGFNMDSSQQKKASEFAANVTTRTITIGAPPPANGDAMTWASSVKDSPVPVKYSLSFIGDLFTSRYMSALGVNFEKIRNNLKSYSLKYCDRLKGDGLLDTCTELSPGIVLSSTRLNGHFKSVSLSYKDCLNECVDHAICTAVSYCISCNSKHYNFYNCYMFTYQDIVSQAITDTKWVSVIMTSKIKNQLTITNGNIVGVKREGIKTNSPETCRKQCEETICLAYTYCKCSSKSYNCFLYAHNRITQVEHKSTGDYQTSFLPFTHRNAKK